ncbi:MAG: hypothetical protein ABIG46_07635 [Candidatus Omnitrophota bacterium]
MKAIIFIALILCFLIGGVAESQAFWWSQKKEAGEPAKETGKPAAEKPKDTPAPKQALSKDARLTLKKEKSKQLNNSEWEIKLASFDNKRKSDKDIIIFRNNQISSQNLTRNGFAPTNYTLTVQEDGIAVWETMQKNDKGDVIYWRAEINADLTKMQGVLSKHLNNKPAQDYSFSSVNKKALPALN